MSIPAIPAYPLPITNSVPANKVNWSIEAKRSVLLIHDMQEYFVRFYGENNPMIGQLQDNIVALRDWAKLNNVPVVYTAQSSQQTPEERALLNDMWGPGLTTTAPELQNVVAQLTPDEKDTVLVKWRYSAFQRSDLEVLMQNWQRDQLIICGIYAHIGCLTTALDAFMRDIQPFMIADAVADFSEEEHHMALKYVATRCGKVCNVIDVVGQKRPNVTSSEVIPSEAGTLTKASLQQRLLVWLDEDPELFDPDENLIDYGLDSIQVMTLISEWEKQGITLSFEELAQAPSLNAWWELIESQLEPEVRCA